LRHPRTRGLCGPGDCLSRRTRRFQPTSPRKEPSVLTAFVAASAVPLALSTNRSSRSALSKLPLSKAPRMTLRPVSIPFAFLLVASSNSSAAKLTGTATYRERLALTPYAVLEATLEDVPKAGAKAVVVARTRKSNPGQVPIAFELEYDPHLIDAE